MNDKPREWVLPLKTLIINDGKGLSAWLRQDREDETHVIEYSAYERAMGLVKDHDDDWKRIQDAERALEAERVKSAKLVEALELFRGVPMYSKTGNNSPPADIALAEYAKDSTAKAGK